MDAETYERLSMASSASVHAAEMAGPDRTLLVGKDCYGRLWHVYQQRGLIHRLLTVGGEIVAYESGECWRAEDLAPDGKLFPERCDHVLVERLMLAGVRIHLARFVPKVWDESRDVWFKSPVAEELRGGVAVSS